jgi:hypothetical protein
MEKFKDRLGREWSVEVDNSMLPDFKDAGLDLSKFPRDETPEAAKAFSEDLMRLMLDPERLGMILWTLCAEKCEELKIDERGFARGFNADALSAACDAVLVVLFDHVFRRPELRKLIRERLPQMWQKVDEGVATKLADQSSS